MPLCCKPCVPPSPAPVALSCPTAEALAAGYSRGTNTQANIKAKFELCIFCLQGGGSGGAQHNTQNVALAGAQSRQRSTCVATARGRGLRIAQAQYKKVVAARNEIWGGLVLLEPVAARVNVGIPRVQDPASGVLPSVPPQNQLASGPMCLQFAVACLHVQLDNAIGPQGLCPSSNHVGVLGSRPAAARPEVACIRSAWGQAPCGEPLQGTQARQGMPISRGERPTECVTVAAPGSAGALAPSHPARRGPRPRRCSLLAYRCQAVIISWTFTNALVARRERAASFVDLAMQVAALGRAQPRNALVLPGTCDSRVESLRVRYVAERNLIALKERIRVVERHCVSVGTGGADAR